MMRLRQVTVWCAAALLLQACMPGQREPAAGQGSAALRLKPASTPLAEPVVRRTVYVPVYSSLYLGKPIQRNMVDLSATVSIRNVSPLYPVVLNFVRYYDSAGTAVRDYLTGPSELAALASVEFVIPEADTSGGPGANFLVQWTGSAEIDEPLIEAVMVGQSGNAGISFTSPGRVLKGDTSPPR